MRVSVIWVVDLLDQAHPSDRMRFRRDSLVLLALAHLVSTSVSVGLAIARQKQGRVC